MALSARHSIKLTIDKALKDLPSMGGVVAKILQLTSSSTASATEIEKLVMTDQGISTKLLRVVNSPYFGLTNEVTSVSQAIVILGFTQVRNLVLTLGAASVFAAKTPKGKEAQTKLWQHAFGTAACGQVLARSRHMPPRETETVFIGGLLLNIGGLFLLSEFPTAYLTALSEIARGVPIVQAERRQFRTNHAEIGMQLAKVWNLPVTLGELIANHEGPFEEEPRPILSCVHAADRIAAEALAIRTEPKALTDLIDPKVNEWLGLTQDEYHWILDETRSKITAASEVLGLFA